MRHLLILSLLFASCTTPYNFKRAAVASAPAFVGGAAYGLHEATQHHYSDFQARFPKADPNFWNPAVSHEKPIYLAYKFDAKHMLATTTQLALGATGATIAFGKKRPWWHYALDAGISFGAYSLGNHITYKGIYLKHK